MSNSNKEFSVVGKRIPKLDAAQKAMARFFTANMPMQILLKLTPQKLKLWPESMRFSQEKMFPGK